MTKLTQVRIGPLQAPAPLERRKINLAPRSVPPTPALNDSSSEPTSNTKGIFGSAKPIDSASREREAAEKLAQRDDDRRKAREVEVAKAKEEDDKARQFSEERAKAIRDAQEKARAELAGAPNGGAEAGRGERSRNTNVRPTRKVSNDVKSPKSPVSPSTEDGFEGTVSRGPKAAPRETNGQAEKKDNPARKGFSFAAAAAAAGGLVDEDEDEGKTNGDVNGINRVTEKLGEVEV